MALTNYYVDPSIAGDSGAGTVGDPYGDLQYALNTITRDSTNGDRINIKAGTAEVLSGSLDLTTYGTPTDGAPLMLQGYTSAVNDQGVGEIDCNGNSMFASTALDYMILADLECHSFGNNNGIHLDNFISIIRCTVHKGDSSPSSKYLVYLDNTCLVLDCHVYDAGTTGYGVRIFNDCMVIGNYLATCPAYSIYLNGGNSYALQNVVNCSATASTGIYVGGLGGGVIGNSAYNSTAGTAKGIDLSNSAVRWCIVYNNIVQGWSGVGGVGLALYSGSFLGWNAFYNCTTNTSITNDARVDETDEDHSLGASPFTNPGSGDFTINGTVTGVTEDAYPTVFRGVASTLNKAEKGAVQAGAGAAGGGNVNLLAGKVGR